MWVSEGRILETDRLATNSMHHQRVRTVAPMLDPVAYGPDGLERRLRCVTGRSSWEFSGTLNSLRARGKWGCLFVSLAQEAIRSHTATVDARGRCRLNIKKAPDARSWPTMEYADGI